MLEDTCHQYEKDVLGTPYTGLLPALCSSPNVRDTTWQGHQNAFNQHQSSLDNAISCYETRGQQLFQARGDSSQLCDRNNSTYKAALEWRSSQLRSGNFKPRSLGGTAAPAIPPAPIILTQPEIIWPPPPEGAPEPPPPYGRGNNVPSSADCGVFCDILTIGLLASLCLPALGGLIIAAPEVVIGVGATCATNPQLCVSSPVFVR